MSIFRTKSKRFEEDSAYQTKQPILADSSEED
jgi:hypothetical protein